eukprot:Polyplicarium_translucidae@DN1659_c0_g1_i4.p3
MARALAVNVGHAAGNFYFPESQWSSGVSTLVYGAIFPGGLMAISFTGCELYTGNTAAMWMNVLDLKGAEDLGFVRRDEHGWVCRYGLFFVQIEWLFRSGSSKSVPYQPR